ncbi:MAG: hypothetical protein GX318_04575 [Clostridia bacterium]|nr:hypothetical protein [Clostridia bacterium]
MSIRKTRSTLYKVARILGDVEAVTSGDPKKITRRMGRKTAGRATGRIMRRLFK